MNFIQQNYANSKEAAQAYYNRENEFDAYVEDQLNQHDSNSQTGSRIERGYVTVWTWLVIFGYFFAYTTITQFMRLLLVKKWYKAHRSHAYQNLARITGSHLKVTSVIII